MLRGICRELYVIVCSRAYADIVAFQPIQTDERQVTVWRHQPGQSPFPPLHDFCLMGGNIQRRFVGAASCQQTRDNPEQQVS